MQQTTIANSTIAGVVSYPVIAAALTTILAITGIAIPPFAIGALVVNQTMDVSVLATLLSYVITHFTSDSVQQQIAELAKLATMIPKTYSAPSDYPNPPPQATPSNIANAQAAIAVIQAHAGFPTGKNGV